MRLPRPNSGLDQYENFPRVLLRRTSTLALVLSAAALACLAAADRLYAKPLKDQPPPSRRMQACPWSPPAADAIDMPQAQIDAEADDDEDDDEDDAPSKPGDVGSSAGPGMYAAGHGCILIDTSVNTGTQVNVTSTKIGGQGTSLTTSQSILLATANVTHYAPSEYGDIITRVSFGIDQANNGTMSQASIAIGKAVMGLHPSFYDAWAASEFSFRALTPSQSPMLAAVTFRPSDNSTVSLAIEDPSFRRTTISGYGGLRSPDLIARGRYSTGPWQLIVSGALHQTTFADPLPGATAPDGIFWGGALQAFAKYTLPNEAQPGNAFVLAQIGYARQAAGYLGINNPTSAFAITLPGVFGAKDMERTNGWNAASSIGWAWSERWRSAAFASMVNLQVPDAGDRSKVVSRRAAINVTYSPAASLDFTLELGASSLSSQHSLIPSLRQYSVILAMSHSLP